MRAAGTDGDRFAAAAAVVVESPMADRPACRVAVLDHVPSAAELEDLVAQGVTGFELTSAGPQRELDWLEDLEEVRMLEVELAPGARVPAHVLARVESLTLLGRGARLGVSPEELVRLTSLEVSAGAWEGRLALFPALAVLTLRTFPYQDLRVLDECFALTKANLNARGGELRVELDGSLPALTELQTRGLWPVSLRDAGAFPSLTVLQMGVGRPCERDVPLDLAPLGVCHELRVVALENIGPFAGRESLEAMPGLTYLGLR